METSILIGLIIGLAVGWLIGNVLLLFFQKEIFSAIDRIVSNVRSACGIK